MSFCLEFEKKDILLHPSSRPGGGIGRRAGLKIQCPQGRAGSTPAAGIVLKTRFSDLVFFSLLYVFTIRQVKNVMITCRKPVI